MLRKLMTVGLIGLLTLVMAGTAMAADPFTATGTVVTIGESSFEMDVEGTVYTVLPPEGFDLLTLAVDDTVQVEGEVEADVVTATSVLIVLEEAGPEPFMETGTVVSVGETSFEMDVEGTIFVVFPPEGFDLSTLAVDDTVEVEGEVEEGVVTATSILIVPDEVTGPEPFMETGTVVSIGETSFEMNVEGTIFVILPPEGFDLSTLMVDDTVQVEGEVEDGVVTATSIVLVIDDEEEEIEYLKEGHYCENPDDSHPALQKLADRYDADYEEVLAFFCGTDEVGHNGVGGIKLAYKTSETLGDGTTPAEILQLKQELGGWGKVWQYLGLKGNKKDKSDDTGDGEAVIEGDATYKKNGKNKNTAKGKPSHAGPPDHANNDKDKDKNKDKNNNKDKNKDKNKNKNKNP